MERQVLDNVVAHALRQPTGPEAEVEGQVYTVVQVVHVHVLQRGDSDLHVRWHDDGRPVDACWVAIDCVVQQLNALLDDRKMGKL